MTNKTNTFFNIVVCGVGGQGTVLSSKLLTECALRGGAFVRCAETIGMAMRGGSVLGHVRILGQRDLEQGDGVTVPFSSESDSAVSSLGENGTVTPSPCSKSDSAASSLGENGTVTPSLCSKSDSAVSSLGENGTVTPSLCSTECQSPLVPVGKAQLLIGFEPVETLRAYRFCSTGALVVTATDPLMPPAAAVQGLKYNGKAQLAALELEAAEGRIGRLELVNNSDVMDKLGFDKALNVVLLGAALGILAESNSPYASLLSYEAMQGVIETSVKPQFVEFNLRALELGYQLQT